MNTNMKPILTCDDCVQTNCDFRRHGIKCVDFLAATEKPPEEKPQPAAAPNPQSEKAEEKKLVRLCESCACAFRYTEEIMRPCEKPKPEMVDKIICIYRDMKFDVSDKKIYVCNKYEEENLNDDIPF